MKSDLLAIAKKMRAMFAPTSIIAQEWDRANGIEPAVHAERSPFEMFQEHMAAMKTPDVLELGTAQSIPGRSTLQKHLVPHAGSWTGSDITAGPDVDIVADVHRLRGAAGTARFDAVITCSGFEHFKYPHLAAHQIAHVLKIGGAVAIQTHFTFVEHSYPYDYCRFTRKALEGLFGTKNGMRVVATNYEYPCRIESPTGDGAGDSHLNVTLFAVKTGPTPENYVYEFDTNL